MKKYIKSSADVKTYEVNVGFCGYVGSDQFYNVTAASPEEAMDQARDEAEQELEVISVNHIEDDEYEVTVCFAGLVGVETEYTVYADDELAAEDQAIEEAKWDLTTDITDVIEDELFD